MMIYIIHYLIHSENEKNQKRDDVTLMRKNNHASKAKQNNVNVIFGKLAEFCQYIFMRLLA